MKPAHNLFNTSLSTKQRLLEKRDNLNCETDAASLTATLLTERFGGCENWNESTNRGRLKQDHHSAI